MERRLILEDDKGQVVRSFVWSGDPVQVVRREDTRRLALVGSTDELTEKKIDFEFIGAIDVDFIEKKSMPVGEFGRLKMVPTVDKTIRDGEIKDENSALYNWALALLLLSGIVGQAVFWTHPQMAEKNPEVLKQEVIKIVKKIPAQQRPAEAISRTTSSETVPKEKVAKSIDRLKRSGALQALGSLSKSAQRGGLNLGAANTTAGPGLGGAAGSGGTQTSLYAKGLTSAPLGAGNRVEGAGGYGTKGKGGGQAGYGQMTMVGSTGAAPVGLTQEATVATGLDRDAIAAVINRNLGQVRFCYEQGLQGDPNLSGRVAVDFVIGGNGVVKTAGVGSTSLNSKIIEDCILLRLKSWRFPLPQGGVEVKVSYPFVLRRAGQG